MTITEATTYRALATRSMFLAHDRTDIGFAVKELSRRMSAPREVDWKRLKRLGRYLIGKERSVITMRRQGPVSKLDTLVDTDYAGCRYTRHPQAEDQ